jgi:cytohesin
MKWIKTLFGQSAEKQFLKAAESGDADKVKRLIKDGVDKEAKNEEGFTAIHLASQKGHGTIIESLLAAGAEKNAKDNDGLAPLHWAAFKGHCEAVRILLAASADRDNPRRRLLCPPIT